MTSDSPLEQPSAHLSGRLEAVVARTPDAVAIVCGDTAVSYGELARRIATFSAELAAAGVAPRDRVAVVLPNGVEFVVAVFALWRRGAIVTPLHLQFREREIVGYVADCAARAIITTHAMSGVVDALLQEPGGSVAHAWLLPKEAGAWIHRRRAGERVAADLGPPRDPALDSSWPALTQFSTGSTGRAKRVTRTHGHLIGEFTAVSKVLARTEADRVLGVAPFFHSHGLMNAVLGATLAGSRLYAVERFFPRDIAQLVEREQITGFPGGPVMFQTLVEMRESVTLSSLRYAVSAGAPLPEAVAAAFKARYGIGVRELFGCTEAGVLTIEPEDKGGSGEHTVGLPIPGVGVRIVDTQGRPVPAGEEGRVEVTSPYAATCYDQSQEQTEAHFIGPHLYPGDLGRLTPGDGRLVLLGRDRGFINVAGNKADPVEVETVLLEMPAVTEAVVMGLPDGAAGEKIKAVLVTSSPCSREEILAHCARRLAPFKLPRIIEFREALPKNLMGKVLRKYLLEEEAGT
jgi:long-chain acyl-CoA synthetase